MFLEIKADGEVVLLPDGFAIDIFKQISKRKDSRDVLKYIYYMYSPNSKFLHLLPDSRKKLIEREIIKKSIDEDKDLQIKHAVNVYIEVCTDPKFLLLEGTKSKIAEYIAWWKDLKITEDTHDTVYKSLANAEKLLKIKGNLESEIMENQKAREFGGGKAKMFED